MSTFTARREVTLAELTGLPAATAVELLRTAELHPSIEAAEITDPVRQGRVVGQAPQAGSQVRRGELVTLWVGHTPPPTDPHQQPEQAPQGFPLTGETVDDDRAAGLSDIDDVELGMPVLTLEAIARTRVSDDELTGLEPAGDPSVDRPASEPEATPTPAPRPAARPDSWAPGIRRPRRLLGCALAVALAAAVAMAALPARRASRPPVADVARSVPVRPPLLPAPTHHPARRGSSRPIATPRRMPRRPVTRARKPEPATTGRAATVAPTPVPSRVSPTNRPAAPIRAVVTTTTAVTDRRVGVPPSPTGPVPGPYPNQP